MTWGIFSWGTSPFGGPPVGIHIASAVATSTNTVLVSLTAPPLAASGFQIGASPNPMTWTLVRLDNGATLPVMAARLVGSMQVELFTLTQLADQRVRHRVGSTTLLSASGAIITLPNSADFDGVIRADVETNARNAKRTTSQRDLHNVPTPTSNSVGGTLRIGRDGDYETEGGTELLRKLIIRRLVTAPGEFFHLPDYGLGIKVKEAPPGGSMTRLKQEIIRQVQLEPEVAEVGAQVTMSSDGLLSVQLLVRTVRGESVEVSVKQGQNGVQF